MENCGFFTIFGDTLRFIYLENSFISSEKPPGQRTSAILSIFNILIHEIYQKFDKSGRWQPKREHQLSFVEDDKLRPGENVTSSSRQTKITKFR